MTEFTLPHDHGEQRHAEQLHRELMNTARFGAVSEIFKQLSDPTRVRIFWLLSHEEECVINLAAMLEMSSPAVSHHLRSLTESGLLVSRRDGKEVYYRAADTGQIRLLHEIVEQVMEIACPERALDYGASQEEIIRHVHDDLTQNLSERVTIEELARKYLMNTTTLKRVFKQVYGETIAAHIKSTAWRRRPRCCARRRTMLPPSRRRSATRARAAFRRHSRRPTASCRPNTAGGGRECGRFRMVDLNKQRV